MKWLTTNSWGSFPYGEAKYNTCFNNISWIVIQCLITRQPFEFDFKVMTEDGFFLFKCREQLLNLILISLKLGPTPLLNESSPFHCRARPLQQLTKT